jgi:hypothetical protein
LKLHSAVRSPGPNFTPVTGSGRIGNRTGTGVSKFNGPSVCTVITNGNSSPGGSGSGNRSPGTGAKPTIPPRCPSSANNAFAGTVIRTPSSPGFSASTDAENVTVVSSVALTGRSASPAINGR